MKNIIITENQLNSLFCEGRHWMYGDHEPMPKCVENAIDKYCAERRYIESRQKDLDRHNNDIVRAQKEYDNYKKTGSLSPEFIERLFSTYISILNTTRSCTEYSMEKSELESYGNILTYYGFDLDELYNQYKENL